MPQRWIQTCRYKPDKSPLNPHFPTDDPAYRASLGVIKSGKHFWKQMTKHLSLSISKSSNPLWDEILARRTTHGAIVLFRLRCKSVSTGKYNETIPRAALFTISQSTFQCELNVRLELVYIAKLRLGHRCSQKRKGVGQCRRNAACKCKKSRT